MTRVKINNDVETNVLVNCARRCALCVGLLNDHSVKHGQIAHIDRDSSNSFYENLAFLCIPHHDEYDTVRRQSKNFKPDELKRYKSLVCRQYAPDYYAIRELLDNHKNAILNLTNETEHLAVEIDRDLFNAYLDLQKDLNSLIHSIFDKDLGEILNCWHTGLNNTLFIISDIYYIESGWRRKFDNGNFSQQILSNKKQQITNSLKMMNSGYKDLRSFLSY